MLSSAIARNAAAAPSAPGLNSDLGRWKQRLVHRQYGRLARPLPFQEYSAPIEHEGASFYFPLGTNVLEEAASRAWEIHQRVRKEGWQSVFRKYPREFTLAIFWRENPMVFTYTTLYTVPGPVQEKGRHSVQPAEGKDSVVVAVIEPEVWCRRALGDWIDALPGYQCGGRFSNAADALLAFKRNPVDLALVNRLQAVTSSEQFFTSLGNSSRYTPALTYRTYHCSDELFVSQPGVSGGYYFRRRPPQDLLDPIRDIWIRHPPSPAEWQACISGYVQRLFLFPTEPVGKAAPGLTSRERDILGCLCRGIPDKEIARSLKISPWTVHTHLKRVYEKLGVHSRAEAILRFWQG